jgi:hypothetical protein
LALGVCAAGCGQLPPQASTTQSPIFGGTPDTTHNAVMALIDQLSATTATACSGTTVATVGASGIFLTAGHCVVKNDGMGHVITPIQKASADSLFIVPGPDWQQSVQAGLYYGVSDVTVHPQYDGSVNSPFDVALVRFLGAVPAQPVIPALDPTSDKLVVGTTIDVVGFGKTQTNATNSTRFEVNRVIKSITANQFLYDQTDMKGACQGDSGGPALVDTPAGTRVAGVTSFGDPDCTMLGASVRVSPVFASFIQNFVSTAPQTLSCSDCALASVGPGNACVTQAAACATTAMPCGKFLTCANGCTNASTAASCVAACRRNNAVGASAFDAVITCQCGGMCQAVCANSPSCGGMGGSPGTGGSGPTTGVAGTSGATCGGLSSTNAACDSCIQGSCCTQAATCGNDSTCAACFVQATSGACRFNVAFTALEGCLANCPGCSSSAGTAGATGTAGSTVTPVAGTTGTVGGSGGGGTTGQTGGKTGCSCDVDPSPSGAGAAFIALLALALAASRPRVRARASARRR